MKKPYNSIIAIFISILLLGLSHEADAQTYRILPLGNSITAGWDGVFPAAGDAISYRNELYNQLTGAGYSFDFVGHNNLGFNILADADHGGIRGSRDQYVERLLQDGYDRRWSTQITPGGEAYLDIYPADIILLHIGTNDITHGEGPSANDVEDILDEIEDWRDSTGNHITVFVARIINRFPTIAATTEFNDSVALMIANRADPSIMMVDMETGAGLDYAVDILPDGLHPTTSGYNKMGLTWFFALDAYLTALPPAPSGLSIGTVSYNSIQLTWSDNSLNETGFEIERSLTPDGGDFVLVHTTSAGATSWTNTGLTEETQYYYRVRAVNATGPSFYTSVQSATTLDGPPAAPTSLSTGTVTANSIQLTWNDNSDNEDGFRIERSIFPFFGFSLIHTTGSNETSYNNTGLNESTTYYYRVRAYNGTGNSTYSNVANATTGVSPPTAPSGLSVGTVTTSSIQISWSDNSSNETGFQVERAFASGGPYTLIFTTSANVTSYNNTGLDDDTQYFYRVRAINGSGNSAFSNIVNATTDLAPPDAPSSLSTGTVTSSSIQLSWNDNSDSETGFRIERGPSGSGPWAVIHTTLANVTGYTNSGLDDNTQYYYRVRAYNLAGNSSYTNVVNATTDLDPPAAPSGLTTGAVTTSSIQISWSDNSDNETGFQIQRSLNAGFGFSTVFTTSANVVSYNNTGLNDNTQYYYRVRAINGAGNSTFSNVANATTDLAPPDAPSGLSTGTVSSSTIQLNWNDNSDSETGFQVERSLTFGGVYSLIHTTGVNATTYTDTSLEDNTRYYYRVRATNTAGNSAYSNIVNTFTLLAPPDDPTMLILSEITTNSIRLTWTDNADSETGFQIERSLLPTSGFSLIYTASANVSTYNNIGLDDNTQYYYRVRALNAAGFSGYTNTASATTQLGVPAPPTSLTLDNISHNSIRVNWLDNSDNEAGFEIERSLNAGSGYTLIYTTAAGIVNYTDIGLEEDTEYFYRVRATNAAGKSGYSNIASATTLLLPPDPPTGLVLSNETTSSIDLDWTDNSDSETAFEIERSLFSFFGFSLIHTAAADVTSYSDPGLNDDTQYFYRVRAINATGPSAYTFVASTSTLLAVPADPTGMDGGGTNVCTIDLKWVDNADNEDGYELERSIEPTDGFTLIATLGSNSTSYTDPDVSNGSLYYYRVRAFNDAGYSAYSGVIPVFLNVILNGGLIGSDQSVCPLGDPLLITSVNAPTGGGGTWDYQWQSRIPPALYTDIPGAIGLAYDPPAGITQTTEYRRMATTDCGVVYSNVVTITVEDLENPTFTYCPNDTIVPIDRNLTAGLVLTQDPIVLDNCELARLTWSMTGATVASSPISGINLVGNYLLNLGVTTITYQAEDLSGNTAQCSYSISVVPKIPEIISVTIPNAAMKIGDVISATINVSNDGDNLYSLVSGSIGGYPLYNFQRIGATIYLANFAIVEGGNSYLALENIPVGNLVITDGTDQSLPYVLPIIQNNDLLDAEVPVISSMTVATGAYKIGDVVRIDINADGTDYTIHPFSLVNGIAVTEPNMLFTDRGAGRYRISYTVEDGNTDVAPGDLKATLILVKPSGNFNLPYSNLANVNNVTIDAHSPIVTRMEVPDIEVGVGGTVQVTITADGEGYTAATGTLINGIPLSSPRVTFSERSGGLYEVSYVVASGDAEVAPGDLTISMVMADPVGNISQPATVVETNLLEIYTDLPSAVLAGPPEICEEDVAELSVFLQGRGPWSIDLSDGAITTTYDGIASDQYIVMVNPVQTTTYQIVEVRDMNGVANTGSNSVQINVNEKTFVEIINLATGYSVEANPVQLEANIPGGEFTGPGVITSTSMFDPGLADTVNSPHTIVYTYLDPTTGCVSTDSALVFVLGAEGGIFIPSDVLCNNGDPVTVTASNVAGATGSFRLLNSFSQPVPGLTDQGDNTAIIDPTLLSVGTYTVEYQYVDGVVLYIRKDFDVESVQAPEILNLNEDFYCQNIEPFRLQASVGNAVFSGPGVSNSLIGYMFDPGEADPGEITITCSVTSENGCVAYTEKVLTIKYGPEVNFTINSACIPDSGGVIQFNNLTPGKLLVESWNWDFGDPASGDENSSILIDPVHHYDELGPRSISLTATSFEGCISSLVLDTIIGSQPHTDFTWISDCYSNGSGIKFIDRTASEYSELESLVWKFRNSGGNLLGEVNSTSSDDTIAYSFATVDSYLVELITRTIHGCADTAFKDLHIRPTVMLSSGSYLEGFNTDQGLWTIQSEDQVESWKWDVPDFEGFQQDPSDRAWFTDFPSDVIDYRENSWIQSPCFDFTGMERPIIQLDIMKSFVPNLNGAVMQYMDVVEEGWKTLGEESPGFGWYNLNDISNMPGGSSIGWGLEVFNPDSEWVRAVNDLYDLAESPHVSFRIAIATTGLQGIGNQGFAFDNVAIAESSKRSVIEHFTNSSDEASESADNVIDAFGKSHSSSLIDLQYHMNYPGQDPMNDNNPDPSSTRSFYYGIPKVPYAILDGGFRSYHRYDFSDLKTTPEEDHLRLLSLEIPSFSIDLTVDWMESSVDVRTLVTCETEQYPDNIQLYVVVFESSVTAYTGGNGDTEFRNVVLDMLPTPAGKLLGDNWYYGKSDTRDNSWTYMPYVEDAEDLAVAAFVQDRTTGRILQGAVNYKNNPVGVGKPNQAMKDLQIYPNPAKHSFYVNLGDRMDREGRIEILDMNGRVVHMENIPAGFQIYQVDVQQLNRGLYMVRWFESDQISGIAKLVKTE